MAIIRSVDVGVARSFERRMRVGRAADNDLVLALDTVSTFHAHIEWRRDGFYVRDLGSRNGTALNDKRVQGWGRLEVGDVLRFGPDAAWRIEDLSEPPEQDRAPLAVCARDGSARHPVREDRFTFGRGAGFDLVLPGNDGSLVAALYVEDDTCRLVALEDGAVRRSGSTLEAGLPAALHPDDSFEVLGTGWQLTVRPGLDRTATVEAGLQQRAYAHYRLSLTQRGELGDITVHDGRTPHRWTDQELRFSLLQVLAQAVVEGDEGPAWVDDESLRQSIWGRRAAENLASSTLAKLIHDTRSMLGREGIDGLFIEKRRGRTRLRLDPGQIRLD